jgi:hypothetical protein
VHHRPIGIAGVVTVAISSATRGNPSSIETLSAGCNARANMSDNPLEDTPERTAHIRSTAYRLWEENGQPNGRDEEFWERARELVGIENSAGAGLLPNPMTQNEPIPGVTVEEAAIQENYGEFPDRFTDQGDWRQTPITKDEFREFEEGKAEPTRGDAP